MNDDLDKLRIGCRVLLRALPTGFLDGLPEEDQRAIAAMVGKPVTLVGWDEMGSAELHFDDPFAVQTDTHSHSHKIWVGPEFIEQFLDSGSEPTSNLAHEPTELGVKC